MGRRNERAKLEQRRDANASTKPLPKNQKVLEALHTTCAKELEFANAQVQRFHLLFTTVKELRSHPGDLRALERQRQAVRDAESRAWAQGRPPQAVLAPYLSRQVLVEASKVIRSGVLRLRESLAPLPVDSAIDKAIGGLQTILRAYGVYVIMFEQLHRRIVASLEHATGDTKSDTEKKKLRYVPRNPHILRLYFLLLDNVDGGRTQLDIAEELAEKLGCKAKSLLRGVQRLRESLRD